LFLITFLFASTNAQDVRGIWYWTWSSSVNLGSTNLGLAFSGYSDPASAMSNSNGVVNNLQGDKYISLGGGNSNGDWHSSTLNSVTTYCQQRLFSGYTGVAFDIEEGDSGLSDLFISTFNACKSNGYKVLVTVSHSTPYGISDGSALMTAFFNNANSIDYMSPQLYTSGTESSNDFTAVGTQWASYAPFSGKLVPSIVSANLYSNAQSYFAGLGINTVGYVQWSQTASTGPAPSTGASSSGSSSGSTVRCGTSWEAANTGCGNTCTVDGDCPSGQGCYNALQLCSGSNPPPPPPSAPVNPPPPPSSGGVTTVRCGTSWTAAQDSCGNDCSTNADCPSGQSCFNALQLCSGSNPPPPPPPSSSASTTRCGSAWDTANTACGNSCTDDSGCSNGQKCWASLSLAPCGGSQAVAENSNSFSETTIITGKELSPLAIGLIAAGCVVFVVLVAVVVIVVSKSKAEEKV